MTDSYLLRPASRQCNLNCAYCYTNAFPNHGFMTVTTAENIIRKTLKDKTVGEVTYVFSGGEPTLSGLSFFQWFTEQVSLLNANHRPVSYVLQTNGILLNEQWLDYLKKENFVVCLAWDGPAPLHDQLRCQSFNSVKQIYNKVIEAQIPTAVSTEINAVSASRPGALWSFYERGEIDNIQLLFCQSEPGSQLALTPEMTAAFLKEFYFQWSLEYRQGHYRAVNIFDELAALINGQPSRICGMLGQCRKQLVIEADGKVYPCEYQATDTFCCGDINQDSLTSIFHSPVYQDYANMPRQYNKDCGSCPYRHICYGQCRRISTSLYNKEFCGWRQFLDYAYDDLSEKAKTM